MKVICPVCEEVVGAYVPKGGDGSAYRPRRHGDCDGRFELVEELYDEAHLTKRPLDGGKRGAKKEEGEWVRFKKYVESELTRRK